MVSVRLPNDMLAALRKMADDGDESMSELIRRGILMMLVVCPTCGQECNVK
jgi:Arc/MetJ-type ribon-helix-helix transcriptional regulator